MASPYAGRVWLTCGDAQLWRYLSCWLDPSFNPRCGDGGEQYGCTKNHQRRQRDLAVIFEATEIFHI